MSAADHHEHPARPAERSTPRPAGEPVTLADARAQLGAVEDRVERRELARSLVPAVAMPAGELDAWRDLLTSRASGGGGLAARTFDAIRREADSQRAEDARRNARRLRAIDGGGQGSGAQSGERILPNGWSYTPGAGVWRNGEQVIPWCPVVDRKLFAENSRGKLTGAKYTVTVGMRTVTVDARAIADGTVWVDSFGEGRSVGSRTHRETLSDIVGDQAHDLAATALLPRWDGDRLSVPPADVLPAGYGELAGTRDGFRELLREIARSPRMALALGFSASSVYVLPLLRQSHAVNFGGASSHGKTTTLLAAAAIMGNPERVRVSWNATRQGPGARLRDLVTLPGYFDELDSGRMTAEDRGERVFSLLENDSNRTAATRTRRSAENDGEWRGVLYSTGNARLTEGIANEGAAARVIEIAPPLTLDHEHAQRVGELCRQAYGYGLAELAENGPTPAEYAGQVRKARAELLAGVELAARGVGERWADYLAGAVVGVRILADLFGVPKLAADAIDTARALLAEQEAELTARGLTPGDRLLAALEDSWASQPASWPTRSEYARATNGADGTRIPLAVFGWDIRTDSTPGDLAVIPSRLAEIARAAGIADYRVALQELRERGLLHPGSSDRSGPRLERRFRAESGAPPSRVYAISGLAVDGDPNDGEPAELPPTPPAGTGGPAPVEPPADLFGPEGAPYVPEEVPEDVPEHQCAPVVDGSRMEAERRGAAMRAATLTELPAGWTRDLTHPAACARCGTGPTYVRDEHGQPAHPVCPQASSTAELPAAVVEPAREAAQRPTRARGKRTGDPAAVVDHADELANLAALVRADDPTVWPGAAPIPPAVLSDALDAFHAATRGAAITSPSPGLCGQVIGAWLDRLHGVEPLARVELPAEITRGAKLLGPSWVDSEQVPVIDGPPAIAVDVNGQFLGAASADLGVGAPRHIRGVDGSEIARVPSFGRLAEPVTVPGIGGTAGELSAGDLIAGPWVQYLAEDCGLSVPLSDAWVWGDSRRWLTPLYELFRDARYSLQDADGLAVAVAHAAVKAIPNGFIGGWMRSRTWNKTATYRPDAANVIISRARANALRGMRKAAGRPVAVVTDTAWFLGTDSLAGMTVPERGAKGYGQLGKWKVEHRAPISQAMVDAHATGRPFRFHEISKQEGDR